MLAGWANTKGSEVALGYLLDAFPHVVANMGGELLRDAYDTDEPVFPVVSLLLHRGARVDEEVLFRKRYLEGHHSTALRAALCSFSHLRVQEPLVRHLLERGAKAWATAASGNTPLHYLVLRRRDNFGALVRLLVHHGADINAVNRRGSTPLMRMCDLAVEAVSAELDDSGRGFVHSAIKSLVSLGANPSARDHNDCTPLHIVAARGMLMAVVELLQAGADVDVRTTDGHAPLHMACMNFIMYFHDDDLYYRWSRRTMHLPFWNWKEWKPITMTKLLSLCLQPPFPNVSTTTAEAGNQSPSPRFKAGGDDHSLTSSDQNGESAESVIGSTSPSLGDQETLPRRLDPSANSSPSEELPSAATVASNSPEDQDSLAVSHSPSPAHSLHRSRGSSFIRHDESRRLVDSSVRGSILWRLSAAGADMDALDGEGCTPLHWASLAGDLFVAEMLLRRLGASARVQNSAGQTPLHLACAGGRRMWERLNYEWLGSGDSGEHASALRRALVGLLLDRGVDAGAVDKGGWSAERLAGECGEKGLGEFVRKRVAGLEARRARGEDVVEEVGCEQEEGVVRRLKEDMAWQPASAIYGEGGDGDLRGYMRKMAQDEE